MHKWVVRLGWSILIAASIASVLSWFTPLLYIGALYIFGCPRQVVSRLQIPQSDWRIETTYQSCSALDDGTTSIIAENATTGSKVALLRLGEGEITSVSLDGPNAVTITLPNLVYIAEMRSEFGSIAVRYHFMPRDEPAIRAKYHALIDKGDGEAIEAFWLSAIRQERREMQ